MQRHALQFARKTTGSGNQRADASAGHARVNSRSNAKIVHGKEDAASNWKQRIWNCLHDGAAPSSFTCTHMLQPSDMPAGCPEVTVDRVGQLVLPLGPEQADALVAVSEQAPFGKGMATVVDTTVRKALQVDASKVALGASWQHLLQATILPAVAAGLGLEGAPAASIKAELYKLLLYETGGHFAAHRDTEKAPGMFATLVVQLPCAGGHHGGKLLFRHGGRTVEVDTAQASASNVKYTAFFADCEHELLPITGGRRLVLAYNLCWAGKGKAPHAPDGRQAAELAAAVGAWEQEMAAGGAQKRLALQLEHQYTMANLSFAHLKGSDRKMAQVLAACPLLDCHLALLNRTVIGIPDEPARDPYKRQRMYYDYDDEDEESEEEYGGGGDDGETRMQSVIDDSTNTEWCAADDSHITFDNIDPATEYFDPDGERLFGEEPDDESYEEYTGNEGPTLEYYYHRAVLVLWPRSHSLPMARRRGTEALLSLLAVRLQECTTGITGDTSLARKQAHEALEEAISFLEGPPQHPAGYSRHHGYHSGYSGYSAYRSGDSRPPGGSSAMAYALKLVVGGHAAGVPGCEQVAARLLAVLGSQQGPGGGLAGAGVPAALAQLVTVFTAAALKDALLQLVRNSGAAHVEACSELVGALGRLPELQGQVALAAGEALQAAGLGTAAKWKLLQAAVQAQPAVQAQLAGAAADSLLSDNVFAQQQPASVLELSDQLLGNPALAASHYGRFAAACLARQDCQELLPQLLQSEAVKAALTLPAVQELVAARVAYLQARAIKPEFSWCMPEATLPGYPQVEAFLRGPQEQATFKGIFQGIPWARSFAEENFNRPNSRPGNTHTKTFSGKAEAGGIGKNAFCTIVKNRKWFDAHMKQHRAQQRELKALLAMRKPGAAGLGAP